jgi:hypothetical protein
MINQKLGLSYCAFQSVCIPGGIGLSSDMDTGLEGVSRVRGQQSGKFKNVQGLGYKVGPKISI